MKKFLPIIILTVCFLTVLSPVYAQAPADYYQDAVGKSGVALQEALSKIINRAGNVGYDGLYDVYKTSDRRTDGTVWDMYSSTTTFSFNQTCGQYKGEGDCYNREHSVPQSWFGSGLPKSDAWLVYPTDGYVNNRRGNYPFGEVSGVTYSSDGGFSKLGSSPHGVVFEPNDMYKGDFARAYFYAVTRYASSCGSWGHDVFTSSFPHLTSWAKEMMLRWDANDPVSQKEFDRNEAIFKSGQANRNPFIDYPYLVDLIFGNRVGEPFYPDGGDNPFILQPANGSTISLGSVLLNRTESSELQIQGKNLESDVELTLSGGDAGMFSISKHTFSAAEVEAGIAVQIFYTPKTEKKHEAELQISGGGITYVVKVNLTGQGIDGFVATDATDVLKNSFRANWTPKDGASDYELSVSYIEKGSQTEPVTVLKDDFSAKRNNWTYSGYTNVEKDGGIRLASGSNDGTAATPSLNLSEGNAVLYIKAKPYNDDLSTLYIYLNNQKIDEISFAEGGGSIEKTIPLPSDKLTVSSVIKFEGKKKLRVILEEMEVSTGGASEKIILPGYPKRVGDVTSYLIDGLTPDTRYFYTVTSVIDGQNDKVSNEVSVTTLGDPSSILNENLEKIRIYSTDNNSIRVLFAPFGSRLQVFGTDGQMIMNKMVYEEIEQFEAPDKGIYVVRVVAPNVLKREKIVVR